MSDNREKIYSFFLGYIELHMKVCLPLNGIIFAFFLLRICAVHYTISHFFLLAAKKSMSIYKICTERVQSFNISRKQSQKLREKCAAVQLAKYSKQVSKSSPTCCFALFM